MGEVLRASAQSFECAALRVDRTIRVAFSELAFRIAGNAVSVGTVVLVALLLISGSQFTLYAMWFDMESNKDLR